MKHEQDAQDFDSLVPVALRSTCTPDTTPILLRKCTSPAWVGPEAYLNERHEVLHLLYVITCLILNLKAGRRSLHAVRLRHWGLLLVLLLLMLLTVCVGCCYIYTHSDCIAETSTGQLLHSLSLRGGKQTCGTAADSTRLTAP